MLVRLSLAFVIALPAACQPAGAPRNDDAVTLEDQPIEIDVLANDGDPGAMIWQTGTAAHGRVQIIGNQNGRYRYTPDADFHGVDSFWYEQDGGRAEVTVRVIADGSLWREDVPALPTARQPYALAALDIDHDGVDDLAAHDLLDAMITLLTGVGDPATFTRTDLPVPPPVDPDNSYLQGSMVVCRLDGDDAPDLLIGDVNAAAPFALLARSSPAFIGQLLVEPPARLDYFVAPLCADFTGDGRDDVLAVLADARTYLFENLTPAGAASVSLAVPVRLPELEGKGQLLAVDLNRDGRLDIIRSGRDSISVALQAPRAPGDPLVFVAHELSFLGDYSDAVIADLNADGRDDLVGVTGTEVEVLFNTTAAGSDVVELGKWGDSVPLPERGDQLAAGDLDGDGDLDLAVLSRLASHVTVLENRAPAGPLEVRLEPAGDYAVPVDTLPAHFVLADLDGDGGDDVAVSRFDDRVHLLLTGVQ